MQQQFHPRMDEKKIGLASYVFSFFTTSLGVYNHRYRAAIWMLSFASVRIQSGSKVGFSN